MKLRASAKVNLHLRILRRREDGFHDIETLMVPVSLADEVTVETGPGSLVEFFCPSPDVPGGEDNLAVKAVRQFARETGLTFSARIALEKRIPMGAGLGGGSSDAAAVLRALDSLLGTALGAEALEAMAAKLGSDVPFFIRGRPAVCRGRGEIMEAADFPARLPLLLLKPDFGVETPWAYQNWAASHDLPGVSGAGQNLDGIPIANALERPVFEKFLLLPVIKSWLLAQPSVRVAAMSGSGSTMFAVLKDADSGTELEEKARAEFGTGLWTALCTT